jgi:hypothetical protein
MASALRMPMTKLFGIGATGFNAGEEDLENYNSMIESEIRSKIYRPLRVIISLRMLQMWGFIPKFKFKFKPLRMMTEKEDEEIKTSRQARLLTLYDKALLTSEELGQALTHYDLLPIGTNMANGLLDEHPQTGMEMAQGNNLGEQDINKEVHDKPVDAADKTDLKNDTHVYIFDTKDKPEPKPAVLEGNPLDMQNKQLIIGSTVILEGEPTSKAKIVMEIKGQDIKLSDGSVVKADKLKIIELVS